MIGPIGDKFILRLRKFQDLCKGKNPYEKQRFLCPPSKRSLELIDQRKFSEVHIKVEKPYKFSFLCF